VPSRSPSSESQRNRARRRSPGATRSRYRRGQVAVEFRTTELHDLLLVAARSCGRPPAVLGAEGVGRIVASPRVDTVAAGDLVVLPLYSGPGRAALLPADGLSGCLTNVEQFSMPGQQSPTAGLILSESPTEARRLDRPERPKLRRRTFLIALRRRDPDDQPRPRQVRVAELTGAGADISASRCDGAEERSKAIGDARSPRVARGGDAPPLLDSAVEGVSLVNLCLGTGSRCPSLR